jgi:DNA-binding XRE family transcriptional regulator
VASPRSLSASNGGRRCKSCGTTLAVDNTARLCGRCHREERDQLCAPTQLSDSFFETEEFRAAFESQHIGKVLKAYRSHPRHLQVFGKALNQDLLGRWLDLTQAQVSKLENGKPEQNLETLRNYAQILHLPQHLLWFDFPGHSRLRPAGSPASVDDGGQHRTTATTSEVLTMAADRARRFMTSLQTTSDPNPRVGAWRGW